MTATPRAILFDLDNTLIDRDAVMRRVVSVRMRSVGCDEGAIDAVMARDNHGLTDRDEFCAWLADTHPAFGQTGAQVWRFLKAEVSGGVEPDDDASALLDALRPRYDLALVTNGGAQTQRRKMKRADLERRFEHVFISEEVDSWKPAAPIFTSALRAVDCPAEQALFVGDNPREDIAGATAVGMQTCWISRGRDYPADLAKPTWSVEHVRQLWQVLS